jgi:hypothetical protein
VDGEEAAALSLAVFRLVEELYREDDEAVDAVFFGGVPSFFFGFSFSGSFSAADVPYRLV